MHVVLTVDKLLLCPAHHLPINQVWERLTRQTLKQLDLQAASKVCHHFGNVKVLSYLRVLEHVEEISVASGHVLVLLEEYDAAQVSCCDTQLEIS